MNKCFTFKKKSLLIILISLFLLVSNTNSYVYTTFGEIKTDTQNVLNSFGCDINNIDSCYGEGIYQVICHTHHDKYNDRHYFHSVHFKTDYSDNNTLKDSIKFYLSLFVNINSARRLAPLWNTDLDILDDSDYYNNDETYCIWRDSTVRNGKTIPNLEFLESMATVYNDYRYAWMPSIQGYHPKGGAVVYKHVSSSNASTVYSGLDNDYIMLVFWAEFNQSYVDLINGPARNRNDYSAIWGPYYRYAPNPENKISNSYYEFPLIKKKLDYEVYEGVFYSQSGSFRIFNDYDYWYDQFDDYDIYSFMNDCEENYDVIQNCEDLDDNNYFVSMCNPNCSFNSYSYIYCTTQSNIDAYDNDGDYYSYDLVINNDSPYCVDNYGGRWLVVYDY